VAIAATSKKTRYFRNARLNMPEIYGNIAWWLKLIANFIFYFMYIAIKNITSSDRYNLRTYSLFLIVRWNFTLTSYYFNFVFSYNFFLSSFLTFLWLHVLRCTYILSVNWWWLSHSKFDEYSLIFEDYLRTSFFIAKHLKFELPFYYHFIYTALTKSIKYSYKLMQTFHIWWKIN